MNTPEEVTFTTEMAVVVANRQLRAAPPSRTTMSSTTSSAQTPDRLRGLAWGSGHPGRYVLVVNPNSSTLMTEGMRSLAPPGADAGAFVYYTAPPSVPPSIDNEAQEHLSASEVFADLTSAAGKPLLTGATAVLVACFSNHPLAPMLAATGARALTILDTAVLAALDRRAPFAVITTTPDLVRDIDTGVHAVLDRQGGDYPDARFVGTLPTGLRAIELKTAPRDQVQSRIRRAARDLLDRGARTLILGCSGMSGADEAVQDAARAAGVQDVHVVDGVRAGMVRFTAED